MDQENRHRVRYASTQTASSHMSEIWMHDYYAYDDETPYAIPQDCVFPPLPEDIPRLYYDEGNVHYNTWVGDDYNLGPANYTAEQVYYSNPFDFHSMSQAIDEIEYRINANGYEYWDAPEEYEPVAQTDTIEIYTTDDEEEDDHQNGCYYYEHVDDDDDDASSHYSTESTASCYYF